MAVKKQFCKNGHDRTLPDAVDEKRNCRKCLEGRNTRVPAVVPSRYKPTGNQHQRTSVASFRDHAMTDDLLRHMSIVQVAKKHNVSPSTVRNGRNRVLADMHANTIETAETLIQEYNHVIAGQYEDMLVAEKIMADPGPKIDHGKIMYDKNGDEIPDKGAVIDAIRTRTEARRVINQAIVGKRALTGTDAPKKSVTATIRDVDSIIREKLERLNTHYHPVTEVVDAEIVEV